MDDSLRDFQETKKINSGPKISKPITKKPRKTSKRIKGQKDIRSALKAKKDELVAYTKKFDVICRKSGIDVDPEQLQLAIALSKSLQSEPLNSDCTSHTDISTQEKTNRIRNTLQEYGFNVPKTKITTKKQRKSHNRFKLFSCSNTQRLQVISDKFAQVLFQNVHTIKTNSIIDFPKTFLYYISTSISYEEIKNDGIFYVDGLLENKSKSIGSLLRNWADIPGRPLSPVNTENSKMNFNKIQCSQDELDIVLSGSLKLIKNIIKSKQNVNSDEKNIYTLDPYKQMSQDNFINIQSNEGKIYVGSQLLQRDNRSCSPDIFEDEISICENIKNNTTVSEDKLNDVMDLTECINSNTDLVTKKLDINVDCDIVNKTGGTSKEKYDNLMEITECVGSTSRFNHEYVQNHVIDLTQNSNIKEITLIENRIENNEIDLTQSSNSSTELPIVDLQDKNALDDTVIINACDYENVISKRKFKQTADEQEILDLTQECKITVSNEENRSLGGIFDDYVFGHSDYSEELVENGSKVNDKKHNRSKKKEIDEEINVTKTKNSSSEFNYKRLHEILPKKTSSILIDDYENKNCHITGTEVDKPSLDIINITCEITGDNIISDKVTSLDKINKGDEIYITESSDSQQVLAAESELFKNKEIENKIDLTQQSFDINEAIHSNSQERRNSSLGKKDNVSIDYDDISNGSKYFSKTNGVISSNSEIHEIADEFDTTDKVINSLESDDALGVSQHSEVFEIVDNELNYSLFQSRYENFNTSDGSVTNKILITSKFSDVVDLVHGEKTAEQSIDLDNLPEIDLKGTQEEPMITSVRPDNEIDKNNRFIIKTAGVSPMKDYASMTTLERNKELDKYGIKPFKRKRAIQLLTYIYNQTHPIIDDHLDYVQSPTKKSKLNTMPCSSPKKLRSPKQINVENLENIENIYEVTNEVPIIRKLECSVEDWVFQKREKAKVHSCRVPLHVAFHNYVSCRRALREAILRYEPVNIDVIHKELVGYGHRYDPKDLLKFMDKKCITVKTTDNYGRNNKK